MASFHVSPGVLTTERDYTTIIPGIATSTGGIAGSFSWGPANELKSISNENQLVEIFGRPTNANYRPFFMTADFLSYSTHIEVVRVVGEDARNAVSGGTGSGLTLDLTTINGIISSATIKTPGSGYALGDLVYVAGGVVKAVYRVTNINEQKAVTSLEVVTSGEGYTTSTDVATERQPAVLIRNLDEFENSGVLPEVLAKFPGSAGNSLALSTVRASEFDNWEYANRFVVSPAADVKEFDVKTVGETTFELDKVPGDDLIVTVEGVTIEEGTDAGRYTINNGKDIVFISDDETFTPIGTENVFELVNAMEISTRGYTVSVGGIVQPVYAGEGAVPAGQYRLTGNTLTRGVNTVLLNGNSVTEEFTATIGAGLAADDLRITQDGKILSIVDVAPTTVDEVQVAITGTTATLTFFEAPGIGRGNVRVEYGFEKNPILVNYGFPPVGRKVVKAFSNQEEIHAVVIDTDGYWTGEAGSIIERYDFLSLIPGTISFDGTSRYYVEALNRQSQYVRIGQEFFVHGTKVLQGGVSDDAYGENAGVTPAILQSGYSLFSNEEQVEVYHLIVSDEHPSTVLYCVQNIAEKRKDMVTYFSPPMSAVVNNRTNEADACVEFRNIIGSSSYYHMDSNWSYRYDRYNATYRWIACAGASAGCYSLTHTLFDAWYSGAGLNRGRIKNAQKLAWNPDKTARDILYKNNINPITTFIGEGPVLYGDKTGLTKPSAFDRMNVRFLFIVLEKAISKAAKYYLFEQNNEFTRNRFKNMVVPFLRTVKGRQGIDNYSILCNEDNNTPDVVARNEMIADIYIKPVYSTNFITLNFNAVDGTASFIELSNMS